MLLRTFLDILLDWRPAFPQQRSCRRAIAQALGSLTAFGRRTVSRAIWAQGNQHQDWSADYRLHARCQWSPAQLFYPILQRALPWCGARFVSVAIDDTRLRKTGHKIPHAVYGRDPMSPKFHVNLTLGLRFLQLSLLLPLYRQAKASPRALPIRFQDAPSLKKPGKKATAQQRLEYRLALKQHNLSQLSVELIRGLRADLDQAGAHRKPLLIVGDNSFCNRTLFNAVWERTQIVARTRKDIKLCHRAPHASGRIYDLVKFTPEQVLKDERIPFRKIRIFYAGQWRKISCKEVTDVLWQSGAKQRLLRLLVVGPIPYYLPSQKRNHQRHPAFLLTTDRTASLRELLQPYFDRWQIEVNHREEKDTLGVGQTQLRSHRSVPRQPALIVAAYSALLLAGLTAFGVERDDRYQALPKWRRNAKRPSCLDLLTLLRKEIITQTDLVEPLGIKTDWKSLGLAAAA